MSKVKQAKEPKRNDNPKSFAGSQEQFQRFVEAARELECDDDEAAFREKLKKLTEAPPPESVEKRKASTRPKKS